MKNKLLEHLRCLECGSRLTMVHPGWHPSYPEEAVSGWLRCAGAGCGRSIPIRDGVPCFLEQQTPTGTSYGYLWSRSANRTELPRSYHYRKMAETLSIAPLQGLVLDAGCGEGIDLVNETRDSRAEIIGVELSDGGSRISFQRTLGLPCAHVVQADLRRLPFGPETFDFIYSYGVLHHLADPPQGMTELVRVLKPGARAAIYLYEDFSDRNPFWGLLLGLANQFRRLTIRLPHRLLYAFCWLAAPAVFLLFTVPYRLLCRLPGGRRLAQGLPFRHGTGPFSLAGDLYDRFGAPVERRYSRLTAERLLREAGLKRISVEKNRGWMAAGMKGIAV